MMPYNDTPFWLPTRHQTKKLLDKLAIGEGEITVKMDDNKVHTIFIRIDFDGGEIYHGESGKPLEWKNDDGDITCYRIVAERGRE